LTGVVRIVDARADDLDDARVREWVQHQIDRLASLDLTYLPDDFPVDFSPASLVQLEDLLVERLRDEADDVLEEDVVGYLGETLMRVGGGRWAWSGERLVVQFDPALSLPPLTPMDLVERAVDRGGGEEFAGAYDRLAAIVMAYARANPGWEPIKLRTPVLDPEEPPPPSAELDRWLAQQSAAFGAWSGTHANAGPWDFSARSLDDLARALLAELTLADVHDVDSGHPVVQSVAWYLGETLIRNADGGWHFLPGEREPGTYLIGRPFVRRAGDGGTHSVPVLTIAALIKTAEPRALRTHLETFING
jgi:hypothetical protein